MLSECKYCHLSECSKIYSTKKKGQTVSFYLYCCTEAQVVDTAIQSVSNSSNLLSRIKFIVWSLSDRGFVNNHLNFYTIHTRYDRSATMVSKNPLQLRSREIVTSRANSCIINERKSVCLYDTRIWDRAVISYDCKIWLTCICSCEILKILYDVI